MNSPENELPQAEAGMGEDDIQFAQMTSVRCPHCQAGTAHVMWYSVRDNITYYCCPACGRDFYGKVNARSPLSIKVYTQTPPSGRLCE